MDPAFRPLDFALFITLTAAVLAIGLIVGRREETSEDYFLAGRAVPWWGVAGATFGSNIGPSQVVGMLGIGYSIGFAQSHYEFLAIFAMMLLCYGFLPVYRRMGIFTLSEYLGRRYDDRSRLLYTAFLIVLILVQIISALYIGSRSLGLLLRGTAYDPGYAGGVVLLAAVATCYTVVGGMKAVVWTDVIQSTLLLVAGLLVAALAVTQPEIAGVSGLLARDAALPPAAQKVHLYLPSDHRDLPWTGALSGLLVLHVFFWGTNQYVVQRALGARSDRDARLGIIGAGFLKLLVPFFSVGAGIAAYHLFRARLPDRIVAPDAAFAELVHLVVRPGWGLMGVVATGLVGAILATLGSMMNSASTLFTVDIYAKYLRPRSNGKELILAGRLFITALIALSIALTLTVYDPNAQGNFFLVVSDQCAYLKPGIAAVFVLGMFYGRATASGAVATILSAPAFSFALQKLYNDHLGPHPFWSAVLGARLNFLHRTFATFVACLVVHVVVSAWTARERDAEKEKLTWSALGGLRFAPGGRSWVMVGAVALCAGGLAAAVAAGHLRPSSGALLATAATGTCLGTVVVKARARERGAGTTVLALAKDDRTWACVLLAATSFLLLYFF